jgi:hypothetical protein
VRRDERPVSDVPGWLWAALFAALAAQIAWQAFYPAQSMRAEDLPPPPRQEALRLASFGEPAALARLAMLYVQAFDLGGANELPYRKLDFERLIGWLGLALALDPRSTYPLFLAARVYTEGVDPPRLRLMLDFVYREFMQDPDRRWPWLAHCALLAKHRLGDLPLARDYAAAIARYAKAADVPPWAKQMEIFILEDMNELEAAKVLLGGLLASGKITDPTEARFLKQRLDQLEARLAGEKVK